MSNLVLISIFKQVKLHPTSVSSNSCRRQCDKLKTQIFMLEVSMFGQRRNYIFLSEMSTGVL